MNGFTCWVSSFTKQDVAAWVQAIGSIVTIAGAFLIANRQHKNEIRDRKQEDIDRRIRVAYQITHLTIFANWPHADSKHAFPVEQKLTLAKELDIDEQERKLLQFESFPIFEVKDPMPLTQMARMSANWREGIKRMKRAKELALAGDSTWESAFDDLASFHPQSESVKERLQSYVFSVKNATYRGYEPVEDVTR